MLISNQMRNLELSPLDQEVFDHVNVMESKSEQVSVKSDREADNRSLTPDWVVVDDAKLVEELASDYNQYLNFDLSKDEAKFSESIEDMLTKLDEFCALTDMIRSDITLCLTKTLPGIQAKCREMEAVFDKIDKLEAFIGVVRQNVAQMEEQVSRAEEVHGSFGGIMKKLTSIVSPKRKRSTESTSQHKATFQPPVVFSTSDYFTPDPTTGEPQTHTQTGHFQKHDSIHTSNSGVTVDTAKPFSSGQSMTTGDPGCRGPRGDTGSGELAVTSVDSVGSRKADSAKADIQNKPLELSSKSSRDSGSGDQKVDKSETVVDAAVANH